MDASLKAISRACRESSVSAKVSFIILTFDLLEHLAELRCPQAASVYKLTTFLFIENFAEQIIRETMSMCFIDLLNQNKSIPINILLEPLLRNYFRLIDSGSFTLELYDCKLLFALIDHRKFSLTGPASGVCLQLVDMLTEAMFNFPVYAVQASSLIIFILKRLTPENLMETQAKAIFSQFLGQYLTNVELKGDKEYFTVGQPTTLGNNKSG